MVGTILLWFSLMWGFGVILQIGFTKNPRQRKIFVGNPITSLLTLGAIQEKVAVVPTLFQLNALIFLVAAISEYTIGGFTSPILSLQIWLIGFVICALLTPIFNQRS